MKKLLISFLLVLPVLAFAQPVIPGYLLLGTYGGHVYYHSGMLASDWAAAQADCQANGGYLACITSADEQAFLVSMLPNQEAWIGGSAPLGGPWSWVTGETWSYSTWISPWPLASAAQNGVVFASDLGGWGDITVTTIASWILEVGAVVLPVEMTSFTATSFDRAVTLRWRTETESENSHFNLYRSTVENERGELVAQVEGHGTTATANSYSFSDRNVQNGTTYYYRISDVSVDGQEHMNRFVVSATPSPRSNSEMPLEFDLKQNFPNPFNPTTSISYSIAEAGKVSLKVFNEAGQEVATLVDGIQSAKSYKVEFNAANLPSGTYYYSLTTPSLSMTKKMTLVK